MWWGDPSYAHSAEAIVQQGTCILLKPLIWWKWCIALLLVDSNGGHNWSSFRCRGQEVIKILEVDEREVSEVWRW